VTESDLRATQNLLKAYVNFIQTTTVAGIPVVNWEDERQVFEIKIPSEAMTYAEFCAAVEVTSGYSSYKLHFYTDTNNLIKEECQSVDETTFSRQLKSRLDAIGHGVNGTGPILFIIPENTSSPKLTGSAAGNQKT
jgi:hypothetical protein